VLLSKWKWRFLSNSEAVWADLLRFRYDHLPAQLLSSDTHLSGSKESIWWKDVIGFGRVIEEDWWVFHYNRIIQISGDGCLAKLVYFLLNLVTICFYNIVMLMLWILICWLLLKSYRGMMSHPK
jgi:hypothetical protein